MQILMLKKDDMTCISLHLYMLQPVHMYAAQNDCGGGLLDTSGRVTAFWMRCRMDVTNGVDNARVTALGERWVQFAEERHPSLQRVYCSSY